MAVRVNDLNSTSQAMTYYTQEYSKGDYYTKDDSLEVVGTFHGRGAQMLGIEGRQVDEQSFRHLMQGLHPETGEKLTARLRHNRRSAADLTFSAPKGVSVAAAYQEAQHNSTEIRDMIRSAALETIRDLEKHDACTRVRKGLLWTSEQSRKTGSLVVAEFDHAVGRPVNGIPDPHRHYHFVACNITHDSVEDRWKALDLGKSFKNHAQRIESEFEARLAYKLQSAGYEIGPTSRVREDGKTITGWDLKHLDPSIAETFSRRSSLVVEKAMQRGKSTDGKTLHQLAARSREGKKDIGDLGQLEAVWFGKGGMLDDRQRANLEQVANRTGNGSTEQARSPAAPHVAYALGKLLEDRSVVSLNQLKSEALKSGIGRITPEDVRAEIDQRTDLLRREYRGIERVTTREIWQEEQEMFARCRGKRDIYRPFYREAPEIGPIRKDGREFSLSPDQKRTVKQALTTHSRGFIQLIEGDAGTGKSTVSREIADRIRSATGQDVQALAPSHNACDVLREDGFADARTVQGFLYDREALKGIAGRTLLVDEASLLDNRQTVQLLKAAEQHGARHVIFMGDCKQHFSPGRGDSLRLIRKQVDAPVARLNTVQRQEPEEYRRAVSLLADGELEAGFDRLDQMGSIRQVRGDRRYRQIAESYLDSVRKGETVLCVSPTHRESEKATGAIRSALIKDGQLGRDSQELTRLTPLNRKDVEKADAGSYRQGEVVEFHRRLPGGIGKGTRLTVLGRDDDGRVMACTPAGREYALPLDKPDRFEVYRRDAIAVRRGEVLRLTSSGTTSAGHISGGTSVTVKSFTRHGDLELSDGRILSSRHAHWNYGYVRTSHGSQGSTVDKVIVAQSSLSHPASSKQQWYVSCTRARRAIEVYTDNREALKAAVDRSADRLSATELLKQGRPLPQPAGISNEEMLEQRKRRLARMVGAARDQLVEKARGVGHRARQFGAAVPQSPRATGPELSR